MEHYFYTEHAMIDLRYMVSAERGVESDDSEEFLIFCLLEVGHVPQRMMLFFHDRELRDQTYDRLIAMHRAWAQWRHGPASYPTTEEETN